MILPHKSPAAAFFLVFLLLITEVQGARAGVPVRSALLLNMTTGQILYQKSPDMQIPPASLTKVMTSYIVHDAIRKGRLSYGSRVRVPVDAVLAGGSTMHLRSGERLTVQNLLEGMLIASGNDAATALAYRVSGNPRAFVGAMNAKAHAIGMNSTVFKNPTGLPAAGQTTTARDLMRLALAYMSSYPGALKIHSQCFAQHGRRTLTTTNPFLGENGVDGLKTGFTVSSGYNIIVTAKRGGTRLLIIVLGGRSAGRRNMAARALLDAGFKNPADPSAVRRAVDGSGVMNLRHSAHHRNKARHRKRHRR